MNLIFVGPQGSGKGTQAKIISAKMGLCHISSGDLLRAVLGELKKEVDKYINVGKLVPSKLIIRILKDRLKKIDCSEGVILDGFPRNISQAIELDKIMKIDEVIEIYISDEESIHRISGRRGCNECGALYNVVGAPKPLKDGVCDKCGSELVIRLDDNESALKARLKIYHDETELILKHYSSIRVDGSLSIDKLSEKIIKIL